MAALENSLTHASPDDVLHLAQHLHAEFPGRQNLAIALTYPVQEKRDAVLRRAVVDEIDALLAQAEKSKKSSPALVEVAKADPLKKADARLTMIGARKIAEGAERAGMTVAEFVAQLRERFARSASA